MWVSILSQFYSTEILFLIFYQVHANESLYVAMDARMHAWNDGINFVSPKLLFLDHQHQVLNSEKILKANKIEKLRTTTSSTKQLKQKYFAKFLQINDDEWWRHQQLGDGYNNWKK